VDADDAIRDSMTTAVAAPRAAWSIVLQTGATLAAAMGVGRFVFTPILPLMEAQAHLAPAQASLLATGNYLGYLVGAALGIALPVLARTRVAARSAIIVLIVTLLAMPLTTDLVAWIALRGIAGLASAVMFMVAGNAILDELSTRAPHAIGWAYGGVGAGIATSGILVAVVSSIGDWRAAWWSSAALAALLAAIGWFIGDPLTRRNAHRETGPRSSGRGHRAWFIALGVSYFFEGAGYIIAGTFLVAAVTATGPDWLGHGVWTIAGLAALPSCALWTWLALRVSRPTLITGALLLQAVGIALPVLSPSAPAAVASAVLFGATFVGITTLSLATGRHLRVPGAIAILTTGYGVGQVVGPLIVAPTLGGGYRVALVVAAGLVLIAAVSAALLRVRFPHQGAPHRGARRSAPGEPREIRP
jgi:predicted MFS family arabinose efflux permease